MSFPTAYTPLESLLLFQALRCEGVHSHAVFNRISDTLKKSSLVRNDPSFDSGRLSPDALRELYLWLLKEEAKRDVERQDGWLQNGYVSPGSRKRKAPSPSLPTVQEASKHEHLIPQLVTRLYTRYRDHTVRDIREHERKYDVLTRDISEIEAGKWDDRLQRQRTASRTQSPRPSSSSHLNKVDFNSKTGSPLSPSVENNAKPYKSSKIGDVINHGPEPSNDSGHHRRNSSNTTLPPLSEMAPQSPRFGIPPKMPGPINTNFDQSPSNAHQSPYAPHHGHPGPGGVASPGLHNSLSRPSSSPRPILPPPPGMGIPPQSPGHQLPPHQQYAQPHRIPSGFSPTNGQGFAPPPQGQLPPHAAGYYQPQQYPDRRTSYPQQVPPPGYPSHSGGYQLAPFPVEQQDGSNRAHQQFMQQQSAHHQAMQAQRTPHPQHAPSAPSSSQRLVPPANARIVSDIIAALATPPRGQRKGGLKRPPHLQPGTPMPSPTVEPLSPVLKRSEPAGRSTRSTRNRDGATSEPSAEPEPGPRTTRARRRPKRELSPHSAVSSTADESARMTRSHSVSTAAGAVPTSDDRPGSRGNVKAEPSTPAGFVDAPEVEQPSAGGGRMTRKRRGTLQSHPQPLSKRSRKHSPDRESEDFGTPPPRSNTVVATRNFHKMSTTIMEQINSHKHASYFTNPVREKDAPGYKDIIKHPQSLKEIRAAINAGNKAVIAASANLDSDASTGDGSTIELERTADLVPPKGIVNSAQLEKEVMRMFANAVMFNPGDDGMVRDTREMAADVQAMLEAWRGAEKEAGVEDDVDEKGEVEETGRGKRRKV